ncbi:MAG TPA: hypothetical protein VG412_10030 [Acidimicrobiales bacterium]|nr:hypothetical protein [Acidimicrobiales bacterium]
MVALVIILTAVVLMLTVLVAGLLRSHADILKALHDLGAGVGDPSQDLVNGVGHDHGHAHGHGRDRDQSHRRGTNRNRSANGAPVSSPVLLTMGPSLPGERNSTSAPTIAGVTPTGDALAVAVTGNDQLTLLAFLSSGCATCAGFWEAFQTPEHLGLPEGIRLVVVTKGPEMEIAGEVGAKAHSRLQVVMSTDAWGDYEVPGSPFFVLVDGSAGRRIGEGVANHFSQVAELVRRAQIDMQAFGIGTRGQGGEEGGSRSRAFAGGLDGPARESANDEELRAAGILPGDPSLYPTSLDDVFPSNIDVLPPQPDRTGTHPSTQRQGQERRAG